MARPPKPANLAPAPRHRNRSEPKPKLRDLTREEPTRDEQHKLWLEIRDTHPAATAVIGAAILEYELENIIKRRLPRADNTLWNELTNDNGPLSSFYTKITFGYALKIYNVELRNNLNIIRNIRNVFAHAKRPIDFSHTLIVNELNKVQIPRSSKKDDKENLRHVINVRPAGAKLGFVILCLSISTMLLRIREKSLRAKVSRQSRQKSKLEQQRISNDFGELLSGVKIPPGESPNNFLRWLQAHRTDDPNLGGIGSSHSIVPVPPRRARRKTGK
jgi:hypothetical protein